MYPRIIHSHIIIFLMCCVNFLIPVRTERFTSYISHSKTLVLNDISVTCYRKWKQFLKFSRRVHFVFICVAPFSSSVDADVSERDILSPKAISDDSDRRTSDDKFVVEIINGLVTDVRPLCIHT